MAALPLQSSISQTTQLTKAYRSRVMRLGDGYSQRVPDGINAIGYAGTINYIPLSTADFTTLQTFLDGIGSWGTFDYTPPGAAASCKFSVDPAGPSITAQSGGYYVVSFAVRQEFDLS